MGTKAEQMRVDELHGAVDNFLEMHRAWQADELADHPPEAYWAEIPTMLAAFGEHDPRLGFVFSDVPTCCRALAHAAMQLESEAHAFTHRGATYAPRPGVQQWQYPSGSTRPRNELWRQVETLAKLRDTAAARWPVPSLPALEPMAALEKQRLSAGQIANIWGCSVSEVNAELTIPGSICTPEFIQACERRRYAPAAV